jgi:4-aminobutyrate aminotransferase-like enzyme
MALAVKDNIDFVNTLRAHGLITVPGGNGAVRLLPPLNVSAAEISQALDIIGRALSNADSQPPPTPTR